MQNRRPLFLLLALLALIAATQMGVRPAHAAATPLAPAPGEHGKIVVANRNSGTISVISTQSDQVVTTIELPPGDSMPEPMYVYYAPIVDRVFVGDRANDRVVAYDAGTMNLDGVAEAGAGVFHMWGNSFTRQLWVNNDIDNTTTIIDMWTLESLATVPTPVDLVALGGKPHDVILSPDGLFAYVTVLGVAGANDYVVQYFTPMPGSEFGRAAVGKDPHVSLARQNPWLFVPCQDSDAVFVLDRLTLREERVIAVPGAHGAGMPQNGKYFYTTNLPGGGADALFVIDTRTLTLVGAPVDAPFPVPHNIALTTNGRKLYLTHSGPNNTVTVYDTSPGRAMPEFRSAITVGTNPFGLAFVP